MSTDSTDAPEQTAASLMADIITDVQLLFEQQLKLMQYEIEEEVHRRAVAIALVTTGFAVSSIAAVMLCFTCVHFLHWSFSPAGADQGWLPLWACFAVVTIVLIAVAWIQMHIGKTMLAWHHPQDSVTPQSGHGGQQ